MLKRNAVELLVLFFFIAISLVYASDNRHGVEEISGTVVAYDDVKRDWIPCIDVCEGSLLFRIDSPAELQPRYIRVDFRYPESKFPDELVKSKRRWRFKLIRTSNLDEPMDEFLRYENVYGKEVKFPIWKRLAGAEIEKLPFGEMLSSYSLAKGGFKLLR
jgi:hypothetical protein